MSESTEQQKDNSSQLVSFVSFKGGTLDGQQRNMQQMLSLGTIMAVGEDKELYKVIKISGNHALVQLVGLDLLSIETIQKQVGEWSESLFGDNQHNFSKLTGLPQGSQSALTGFVEEVGELNAVTICAHQGRRGYDNREKYETDRDDCIGDAVIFLLDYCNREDVSLIHIVNNTWRNVVSKRNLANWEKVTHTLKGNEGTTEATTKIG